MAVVVVELTDVLVVVVVVVVFGLTETFLNGVAASALSPPISTKTTKRVYLELAKSPKEQ